MNKYLNPKNYINFVLNRSLAWLEPMTRKWEKPYLEKFGSQPLKHQPIFIIGAPRTGSTILYQTLTNLYNVLYVDNLVCRFHKNFFFGFWLSNKLLGSKPHNNYEADHGSTKGLHSPSECGQFWYRWLPKDHHFIDYDEITEQIVEEIRKEITAVINYFDKPIIFKNLNAGQRLRLITKCFPNAIFVLITREPLYAAQSILQGKRSLGLKDNDFWGIMPKEVKKLRGFDGYRQVAQQVFLLEKQILRDSSLIADDCFIHLSYESLAIDEVIRLGENFNLKKRRTKINGPTITCENKMTLPINDFKLLEKEINKLD